MAYTGQGICIKLFKYKHLFNEIPSRTLALHSCYWGSRIVQDRRPLMRFTRKRCDSAFSFSVYSHLRTFMTSAVVNLEQGSSSDDAVDNDDDGVTLLSDPQYSDFLKLYHKIPGSGQRVFVIQPRVKWGPKKVHYTTPDLQLAEACTLVETLPNWTVVDKAIYAVKDPKINHVFSKGIFHDISERITSTPGVTAIFLSVNSLSVAQLTTLKKAWKVPVFDRYTVVLQIFKDHAKTKEAKLQVALAELPYIRARLADSQDGMIDQPSAVSQYVGGSGETYLQLRHRLLHERDHKLRKALDKVKRQRGMLRQNRQKRHIPIIAVVGYTNAGKTTLVKALSGDKDMEPRNYLFATLDVTAHGSTLPSLMKVIFMDTVGFISDIPLTLIDAFAATLEDVVNADAIIHIRDISHPDTVAQKHNVCTTLSSLIPAEQFSSMIEVCNKCDLIDSADVGKDPGSLYISSVTGQGLLDLCGKVEQVVMKTTGLLKKQFRIRMDGPHLAWLYKEATVQSANPDTDDENLLLVEVIITQAAYAKFKDRFLKKQISQPRR